MKTLVYLTAFLLLFSSRIFAQTILSAGDIAFTGVNATDNMVNGPASNDDLSFILLRNVTAGTSIYFTDFGWRSDVQAFQTALPCGANSGSVSDGVVKWSATTDMSYGTQVLIRCKVTPTASVGTVNGYQGTYNVPTQYVNIATAGESLFAFQGTLASPTLIAGININTAGWAGALLNCDYNPSASTLPTTFAATTFAFSVGFTGNVRLKAGIAISSNAAAARTTIADAANWDKDAATALALPAPVTLLPVTLSDFSVRTTENKDVLRWTTAEERGVSLYEVEHSLDGRSFTQLAVVSAKSGTTNAYSFTTASTKLLSYYRLRIVDENGAYRYSRILTARQEASHIIVSLYPNPSIDKVRVTTNKAEGRATVSLSNAAGALIAITVMDNEIAFFDLKGLASGLYIVRYQDNVHTEVLKLVKW